MYISHENNIEMSTSGVCCAHVRKWNEKHEYFELKFSGKVGVFFLSNWATVVAPGSKGVFYVGRLKSPMAPRGLKSIHIIYWH